MTPEEFEKLARGLLEPPKPPRPWETPTTKKQPQVVQEEAQKTQVRYPAWLQNAIKDAKGGNRRSLEHFVEMAQRDPESPLSKKIFDAVREAFPEQAAKAKTRTRGDDFTR